jgi:Amidohydrolase family
VRRFSVSSQADYSHFCQCGRQGRSRWPVPRAAASDRTEAIATGRERPVAVHRFGAKATFAGAEADAKFPVLGVDLNALVAAATAAPARAIRRPSLGRLAVGTEGDATILDMEQGAFEFHDTQGEGLAADRRFRRKGMVVGGKWWPPAGGDT